AHPGELLGHQAAPASHVEQRCARRVEPQALPEHPLVVGHSSGVDEGPQQREHAVVVPPLVRVPVVDVVVNRALTIARPRTLAAAHTPWCTKGMRHRDDARRVADAMAWTDRRDFLPPHERARADEDRPIPIGGGQTNSQPSTVARMLTLLQVDPGHRVLDVGSGSGWTTAILAHLVGPRGTVIGVEIDSRLAHW